MFTDQSQGLDLGPEPRFPDSVPYFSQHTILWFHSTARESELKGAFKFCRQNISYPFTLNMFYGVGPVPDGFEVGGGKEGAIGAGQVREEVASPEPGVGGR